MDYWCPLQSRRSQFPASSRPDIRCARTRKSAASFEFQISNFKSQIKRSVDIAQNTLYLTTPGTYVARDHLTLQVEVVSRLK